MRRKIKRNSSIYLKLAANVVAKKREEKKEKEKKRRENIDNAWEDKVCTKISYWPVASMSFVPTLPEDTHVTTPSCSLSWKVASLSSKPLRLIPVESMKDKSKLRVMHHLSNIQYAGWWCRSVRKRKCTKKKENITKRIDTIKNRMWYNVIWYTRGTKTSYIFSSCIGWSSYRRHLSAEYT